jgi:hypothetical protein
VGDLRPVGGGWPQAPGLCRGSVAIWRGFRSPPLCAQQDGFSLHVEVEVALINRVNLAFVAIGAVAANEYVSNRDSGLAWLWFYPRSRPGWLWFSVSVRSPIEDPRKHCDLVTALFDFLKGFR